MVELRDGERVAHPDQAWNSPRDNTDAGAFVSVQAVVIDARERLWAMDTGAPEFHPTAPGGPKLVCVDLATGEVVRNIAIPADVALQSSYLNDVRVDLRGGAAGFAFSTDPRPADLTGSSWWISTRARAGGDAATPGGCSTRGGRPPRSRCRPSRS